MNASVTTSRAGQQGFSLIELIVAMVVTVVISGAIFGLLTTGGNAFRREPEVAERQQNIRIAMDTIARDIDNAGAGMPLVSQVFTQTDTPLAATSATGAGTPYLNGAGPQGVMGPAGAALRSAPPTGAGADTSDASDILEILMGDSACPVFRLCTPPAGPPTLDGTALTIHTSEETPANTCLVPPGSAGDQGLVLLTDNRLFTIQPATLAAPDATCGGAAGTNGVLALADGLPEWLPPGGAPLVASPTGIPALLYAARVVRYTIAPGLDPMDPSPGLWRSETGRYDRTGASVPVPVVGATNWQLVARGIEDLQVEYLNGGGLWSNNPGVIPVAAGANCTLAECDSVVRRVRVTLSARALAPLLAGETNPVAGPEPRAVRGQLMSVLTPRPAVLGLQAASGSSEWQ